MTRSMAVARPLRTLFGVGAVGSLTDGQLLERFATRRGEAAEVAFEALVARHGPMVLGVCKRILADPHDAEDAFQATFLVLVKKAGAIRVEDSLGRWLYGVTCRVAARARAEALRRRVREGATVCDRAAGRADDPDLHLRGVLDEELGRLPEKYRAPIVLCYLEGLTHDRAAEQLGWPVGTVRGRLARAREQLRTRLARRGLAPLAGLGTLRIASREALAVVPASLVEETARAAVRLAAGRTLAATASAAVAALTRGVVRTMVVSRLKMAAAAVAAVSMAGPVFLAALAGPGDAPPATKKAAKRREPSKAEKEAIRLAELAFGPNHWSAGKDLPVRYYNHERGYWMYARTYKRLDGGKRLRFAPFAAIWKSREGQGLKTATGDEAIIDLDHPLGLVNGSGTSTKVVHARIEGNVRLRDDQGTPDDPADDLRIGPMTSLEYDEPTFQLRSEADVVIESRDLRGTGSGLKIQLRRGDEPAQPGKGGGFPGVKSLSLEKTVHVVMKNAGRLAILPGKGKAKAEQGESWATDDLRCDGPMEVELPEPGPSVWVTLSRNAVFTHDQGTGEFQRFKGGGLHLRLRPNGEWNVQTVVDASIYQIRPTDGYRLRLNGPVELKNPWGVTLGARNGIILRLFPPGLPRGD